MTWGDAHWVARFAARALRGALPGLGLTASVVALVWMFLRWVAR